MYRFVAPALGALVLTLAACIDLDQEFTINADGSGKVVVKSVFAPVNLMGPKSGDPEEQAKQAVRAELEKAEGVDAWRDVSWSLRDDGRVSFQGTAYFKDISKLKLHDQGMSVAPIEMKKTDQGEIAIECVFQKKEGRAEPPKLTEEEIQKKMMKQRADYQGMKPLLESATANLKVVTRVNLPAPVASVTNFKKAGDASISLTLEGKALAKAMDEVMMDDALLRAQIEAGFDTQGSDGLSEIFVQKIFGEKGPVRAVLAAEAKALFDYEAEAAPARAAQAAIFEKLGGAPKKEIPVAEGGAVKSVRVAGVRFVYEADMESGVTPFSASESGLTLAVVAELPGRVLSVKEGRLTKAVAGDGASLLPESEFKQEIHFPRLTKDQASAVFEIELALPAAGVKSLREVAGTLRCTAGGKTKEVDCGFGELTQGAQGKQFGAKIAEVKDAEYAEGSQQVQLEIGRSVDEIESVVIYDESGKKLEVEKSGYWSSGEGTTLTLTVKGKLPAKGRLALNVYEDLKVFDAAFSIKDVDLSGPK